MSDSSPVSLYFSLSLGLLGFIITGIVPIFGIVTLTPLKVVDLSL